jgi:hypothetical protein
MKSLADYVGRMMYLFLTTIYDHDIT